MDHYTGIVYETFLNDLPGLGSVCSGGRYNNLASVYTKRELPGVGSSIGLDRLMAGLEELGLLENNNTNNGVIVLNMDKTLLPHYHKIASVIRDSGLACEVYLDSKKMGNQFSFADKKGISYAILCGTEEHSSNTVTLKNLATRENHDKIPLDEAIVLIKKG
jgi:histidyl-tRNA synthetase